jgi:hypothetical protein
MMLRRALPVFFLGLLAPGIGTGQDKPAPPPAQAQKRTAPAAEPQKQPAPPAEVHWLQDKRGCKFANPTPKPNESVTWSGACADGYMQGKGVLKFTTDSKPGAIYEGTLSRGRLTGRGTLHTPDGAVYDGDWVDGKQEGYGAYTAVDGSRYEGGWSGGQPDGQGSYYPAKGDPIRGVWENGKLVKQHKY